jgi:hypothetical protein
MANQTKFNIPEVYKILIGALFLASMWYDLKTDFEVHIKSHELIEYRINEMEVKLGLKSLAIVPEKPELKDEDK